MMSKFFYLLIITLPAVYIFFPTSLPAQITRNDGFVDVNKGLPNSFVQEIPFIPEGYKGSFYLDENWHTGTISLHDSALISDITLRCDLQADRLEIRLGDGIRVLPFYQILAFEYKDETGRHHIFTPANHFKLPDGAPVSGIAEVLFQSEGIILLAVKTLSLKSANYNVQIDMGERTPEWVQQEKLYFVPGSGKYLIPAKPGNREEIFGEKTAEVDLWMKQNQLRFKDKENLIRVARHFYPD
ncbi:MAG: hypothetical protein R3C61_03995 [Bacteroidia bacterium]